MADNHYYTVPRLLDVPASYAGVPLMELVPTLTFWVLMALIKHEFVGAILALGVWGAMKMVHFRWGYQALPEGVYCFLPHSLSHSFYKHSPPSHFRFWRH